MTCGRYIRFAKLCLKIEKLLPLLKRMIVNVGSWKYPSILHIHRLALSSLKSNKVERTIEASDYFIKNLTINSTNFAASFYNTANFARSELGKIHTLKEAGNHTVLPAG